MVLFKISNEKFLGTPSPWINFTLNSVHSLFSVCPDHSGDARRPWGERGSDTPAYLEPSLRRSTASPVPNGAPAGGIPYVRDAHD